MFSAGTIIECKGLTKRYGNLPALNSVSIRIDRGAVFALLGPNGAGKTTLVKILVGLLARNTGDVKVFDMDPANNREKIADRVGTVLENAAIYPHMTGRRYLTYFARLFHPKQTRQQLDKRVQDCLRTVGLSKASNMEAGKYSHGMKKRLLFARALINDPELVILDEPLAGLDPLVANRLKEKMIDLNRKGCTVLFSTHVLADAEELCSHVGILDKGRVLAQDSLQGLRQRFSSGRLRIATTKVDEGFVKTFEEMSFISNVRVESEETVLVDVRDIDIQQARRLIKENASVLSVTLVPLSLNQVFLRLVERSDQLQTGEGGEDG